MIYLALDIDYELEQWTVSTLVGGAVLEVNSFEY